ncbi:hypothetical protein B8V81_0130 [Paenibacillus pasadenensis]|uniref:Uncharacterized protein n=1 Tax=Paenibacillus pasadenensis TaxID=217090 RepID=A0A2N5NCF6_9BACL|nr:hypothetical protein B8V81_0130 [Paenibacillus pasadenensis]
MSEKPKRGIPVPQPIRADGAGGIDAGPRDIWRDLENPD